MLKMLLYAVVRSPKLCALYGVPAPPAPLSATFFWNVVQLGSLSALPRPMMYVVIWLVAYAVVTAVRAAVGLSWFELQLFATPSVARTMTFFDPAGAAARVVATAVIALSRGSNRPCELAPSPRAVVTPGRLPSVHGVA